MNHRFRKVVYIATLIFLLTSAVVFASPAKQSRIAFGADFGSQTIVYNRHYFNRSSIGPGLRVEYSYKLDDFIALGAAFTGGYYNYKDFHSYWDLRFVPEIKMYIMDRKDSENGAFFLSASIGVGPGFALREDKEWGIYGLTKAMISAGYEFKNGLGIGVDLDGSITYQNDQSIVTMINAALVVSIPLGGKK